MFINPRLIRISSIVFDIGQAVVHTKFGEGVVLALEGAGETERVQVNFRAVGAKWLVLSFANLQAI